jgi:hypothetical protein
MLGAIIAAITLAGPVQADAPVRFRTVDRGTDSRIGAHYEIVARTTGAWHLLWFKHKAASDRPDIDIRREMVLAVFAGRQPPGAYSLEIASVTHEEGALVVRYRLRRADAVTPSGEPQRTPFHIIAVPAERGTVKFFEMRELGAASR